MAIGPEDFGGSVATTPAQPPTQATPSASIAQGPEEFGGVVAATSAQPPSPSAAGPQSFGGSIAEEVPNVEKNEAGAEIDESSPLHRTLSQLKNLVEGPNTLEGTPSPAGTSWSDLFHHPVAFAKDVNANLESTARIPIVNFNNMIDPEQEKEHPDVSAVQRGLSTVATKLVTPTTFGQLIALDGIGKLPEIAGSLFSESGIPALAARAGQAETAAKAVLTSVGGLFSADQITAAIKKEPKIITAFATGDTSNAVEMTTEALSDLALGYYGARETLHGAGDVVSDLSKDKVAAANPQYREFVHNAQGRNQEANGAQETVKLYADKTVPVDSDQQWLKLFREAGGTADPKTWPAARAKLKEWAAETAAGPQQAGAAQTPPRYVYRGMKESEQGIPGAKYDQASSSLQEAQSYAKDRAVQTGEPHRTVRIDLNKLPKGSYEISGGMNTPDLVRFTKPVPENALETLDEHGNPAAAPQNELGATHVYNPETKKIEPLPTDQTAGTGPKLTYTTDSNGITYAEDPNFKSPEGKPVKVAIPARLTGADRDVEADRLLNLQKDFFASRAAANGGAATATAEKPVTETNAAANGVAAATAEKPAAEANTVVPASVASAAAAREAQDLQDAIREAENTKRPPISPQQRAELAARYDPDHEITPGMQKYLKFRDQQIDRIGRRLQKYGLLKQNKLRENYVPHDFGYADDANSTLSRLFDTYHDAEMAGIVAPNHKIGDLDSDYIGRQMRKINDFQTVNDLLAARTKDGSPTAVPGGFVEGQKVVSDAPQSKILSDQEVKLLKASGQLNDMVRSGRIKVDSTGKIFTQNTDDYEPLGVYKQTPIGNTPVPEQTVNMLRESGSLDKLEKSGAIFHNDNGEYFNAEPLYAKTELYGHPDIAPHFRDVVTGKLAPNSGWGAKLWNSYDYLNKNMKSLVVAWSPFHRLTVSWRILNALGFKEGGKFLAGDAKQSLSSDAPYIDYSNPTQQQDYAIKSGIVVANPRGFQPSNAREAAEVRGDTAEGLGSSSGTWGSKSYQLFNKSIDAVLKKAGVSDQNRAAVLSRIDPEKILTQNVFGPQGMITRMKFAAFDKIQPAVKEAMSKMNPNWSDDVLQRESGRETARMINNKFGGYNNVLAGRTLADQKLLRRVFFAPDFLETTARSVLDLGSKYGAPLMTKMIQFQIAKILAAGAINYAMHRNPNDHSISGAITASKLTSHPGQVVSADNKTVWDLRTAEGDMARMVQTPRQFAWNRIAPLVKDAYEVASQRNEFGRKETTGEAAQTFAKSTIPIPLQPVLGLNSGTVAEPTKAEMFLKSVGAQSFPNRSAAENLALADASDHLEGQPALTGDQLVREQLKFRAEDKLRDALHPLEGEKVNPATVKQARSDLQNLVNHKMISKIEAKNLEEGAQHTRLWSAFKYLPTANALDVWDQMTDQEKADTGTVMKQKFYNWQHAQALNGFGIGRYTPDQQKIYQRFQAASADLSQAETNLKKQRILSTAQLNTAKSESGSEQGPEAFGGHVAQ